MNKRVLLAGVLGAVAMFLWSFVAHDLLPLGVAGMQYIDNEQALLSTMKSTLSAHGMYMFPKMDPKGDMSEIEKKVTTGPSGLIIYFPTRDFSFPKLLAVEFGTELLQALVAVYLLSLTSVGTFGGRLGFFALIGLLAVSATNISYWNWYGFSDTYTCSYMFMGWFGYICAGVVAAVMKVGGSR